MPEFRKGDVCSLEVVVDEVGSAGKVLVIHKNAYGDYVEEWIVPSDLTLIRRAPVDLATCELPVEVVDLGGRKWSLRGRDGEWAGVVDANDWRAWVKFDTLRPADAPAPAAEAGEVERLRARFQGQTDYVISLQRIIEAICKNRPLRPTDQHGHHYQMAAAYISSQALASTAPSCPPGHVVINGHVVPEPMREAPKINTEYWIASAAAERFCWQSKWMGAESDYRLLTRGLIHSTEAAARAHAEALIAPTKREGV